ncbi:MAG: 2-dehydro-3-deoxygalactonokinase [Hyphomicrobiaceae bacterium]
MAEGELIGVDWGTTSWRGYLIGAEGCVLERASSARGILNVANGAFEATLLKEIGGWLKANGPLPVVLSGMIGSRQGWREAPYVACPAGLDEIAARVMRIDEGGGGRGALAIVPGLSVEADGMPDVMRGEETQIFGALTTQGAQSGVFVLPGTHSKWVRVELGRVVQFATYMTGEVFAALKDHTILGRLMTDGGGDQAAAFKSGVAAGARVGGPGSLLNRFFSARTLGLFDRLQGGDIGAYLSGLVIDAELRDATSAFARAGEDAVTLIGSDVLVARYVDAAESLGIGCRRADADCVARGHHAIAGRARLIGGGI